MWDSGVADQTEDERIRALEFMLATRAQQEDHIRSAHAVEEVADHSEAVGGRCSPQLGSSTARSTGAVARAGTALS